MRLSAAELVALGGVAGFVAFFALLPAAVLFTGAVGSVGGFRGVERVVGDPLNLRALENSFVQGALSAAGAVAVGYPAGVFLGRYEWPGRSLARSLLLLPFLLPTLVVVGGVLDLFGPSGLVSGLAPSTAVLGRGLPGILVVNVLFNAPLVALYTSTGCESASSPLEETVASLGGGPGRAYRETWARPTWIGAGIGGLFTFVFSALSFAPPLILCKAAECYTVEAQVWSLSSILLAPAEAAVLALWLVGIFLVPTVACLLLLRRLRPFGGVRTAARRTFRWTDPLAAALASVTLLFGLAEAAMLGSVVVRSIAPGSGGPFSPWSSLFSAATASTLHLSLLSAVGNSLLFAGLAAGIALVLGVGSGFVVARRAGTGFGLSLLLYVPLLLSPVVLAFALSDFWRPFVGASTNVWLLIVVSQASLALPFALGSLQVPLAGLGRAPSESAQALGAGPWTAFVDAELPRVRDGLATAVSFALALGLGEFTATYFLVTSRTTTLPVALFLLSQGRPVPASSALASLLLFLCLAVYLVVVLGGRRVEL